MSTPARSPRGGSEGRRRRAPRLIAPAIVALLRAARPACDDDEGVWVCVAPVTADAIARVAARRAGSIERLQDHPIHEAAERPVRVPTDLAAEWRRDAWQAAREGLIATTDALAISAQIDPPDAA